MTIVEGVERASERDVAPPAVILETKLSAPVARSEHVPRGALLGLLRDGSRRVTLIAAPPGFGKTTLLGEWAAAEGAAKPAWLSLDEADNDPARFFAYVVAALQRVEPGIGGTALAAHRAPGAGLTEVALPLLLNDLAALERDVALVLDDYHLITNTEVHEALVYLIERAPYGFRLVIATREDPPLPLGRLRARGQLLEVRADDLRFTEEETTAFLTDSLGLDLGAADIARLHARAEGWPAALYLAALSLRGREDASRAVDSFAGDDRFLVDYLTTEVLARQPPELRSFLLRTSILNRLCGSLCDAVAERAGSAAVLVELERSNLLLVPLDGKRSWYRYHHLFGELLRRELAATEPDAVPLLHRRASAWYREACLIVDAADHATAAGDFDGAVELAGTNYESFLAQGQLATVMRWIDAVPAAVTASDWRLCYAASVISAHARRLDDAERWLDLAGAAPPRIRNGQEPAGPLAALAGYLRLLRGDIGGAIAHARNALETAAASDAVWALTPQAVLAPALWWAGRAAEATAVLDAATVTARMAGQDAMAVYALGIRAAIALDDADEAAAQALADDAIGLMRRAQLDQHPFAATARLVHGTLLFHHHDLEAAADEITQGLTLSERVGLWHLAVYGSLALAEVRQRQREPAAARRLLTVVRALLEPLPDPGTGPERLARLEKTLRLRSDRNVATAPFWDLSDREMDVLRLLPSRLSQREIAAHLYVSFSTVKTHVRAIFRKLGVNSRAQAVARARDLGLI